MYMQYISRSTPYPHAPKMFQPRANLLGENSLLTRGLGALWIFRCVALHLHFASTFAFAFVFAFAFASVPIYVYVCTWCKQLSPSERTENRYQSKRGETKPKRASVSRRFCVVLVSLLFIFQKLYVASKSELKRNKKKKRIEIGCANINPLTTGFVLYFTLLIWAKTGQKILDEG